ncbi:MAG: glycosyltransferase family 2 protein [Stenomitos rutilans HA7619-LM2]|jgi:GT2 family glycosyltransferase|nr:glycosyltransferase family 2 protein [Stenomitos rutilans HA7619-LM2]
MFSKEPIYILIPVHNRRRITLKCLTTLSQNGDVERYHVVVIDDGSTDGTGQAICEQYPEVEVLTGDGKLWWTGAIATGMKYALSQGAHYIIWLNDDCLPQPGAITKLLKICQTTPRTVVGGQAFDPETHQPSYGGLVNHRFNSTPIHATSLQLIECDGLNGNLVCLPCSLVKAIGYPNHQRFPHYHGDTAYTHLAKRNGYTLLLDGGAVSFCKNTNTPISWLVTDRSIDQLWQDRFTIKSPHYWKAHLGFYQEMFGWFGTGVYLYELLIKFFIIAAIARLIPYHYRVQLKQFLSRSQAT